ncbi:hypothetical protein CsSME_00034414 [Camellia sinensis var. sinensis]
MKPDWNQVVDIVKFSTALWVKGKLDVSENSVINFIFPFRWDKKLEVQETEASRLRLSRLDQLCFAFIHSVRFFGFDGVPLNRCCCCFCILFFGLVLLCLVYLSLLT